MIEGTKTTLFCAWLAWSRFRVVIPLRDKTAPSVFAALDVTLRRVGGAPTYVLTDNEKTVTVEHAAGLAVRNPRTWPSPGITGSRCTPASRRTRPLEPIRKPVPGWGEALLTALSLAIMVQKACFAALNP